VGVLYEHWRTDLNECFYVGISWSQEDTRPYDLSPRNPFHEHVVSKVIKSGFKVETRIQASADWLTKEILGEVEKLQIKYWRELIGDRLTNISLGGEGGVPFNYEDGSYERFCEAVKLGHSKRSQERKKLATIKRFKTLNSRSEEEKKKTEKKRRLSITKGYADQTPDKKEESSRIRSLSAKKAHASKTPEEKAAHGAAISAGRASRRNDPSYSKPLKMLSLFYRWWQSSVKSQHYFGA
jgi:hypothetical protein